LVLFFLPNIIITSLSLKNTIEHSLSRFFCSSIQMACDSGFICRTMRGNISNQTRERLFHYKEEKSYIYLMIVMHIVISHESFFFFINEWKRSLILFSCWDRDCYSLVRSKRMNSLFFLSLLKSPPIYHCSFSRVQSTTGTIITFFFFSLFSYSSNIS
jgi:hypothetical protein